MKITRFEAGGKTSYGLVDGDSITPIEGDLFGSKTPSGPAVPLNSVKLLAPVVPRMIFAVGLNYGSHLTDPTTVSPRPEIFLKGINTLAAHDEDIILPAGCERTDYEGELVVVIGKRAEKVEVSDALNYVYGYTIGNDVSARDWQRGDLQWFRGKSFDQSGPIGPWIQDGLDPENMNLRTRLNGEEVQRAHTTEMINNVAETIAFISRVVTLEPTDIIFTGTSGRPRALKHGDVVEVVVDEIGVLSNRFVDDPNPNPWVDVREDLRPKKVAV